MEKLRRSDGEAELFKARERFCIGLLNKLDPKPLGSDIGNVTGDTRLDRSSKQRIESAGLIMLHSLSNPTFGFKSNNLEGTCPNAHS